MKKVIKIKYIISNILNFEYLPLLYFARDSEEIPFHMQYVKSPRAISRIHVRVKSIVDWISENIVNPTLVSGCNDCVFHERKSKFHGRELARRDLSIKTHRIRDKGDTYMREVRYNSLKLAARGRHRRREALKRIDVIVHFLRTLHLRRRLAYKSRAIPIYTCARQDMCMLRLRRKPSSRGCINSIRPPVSNGRRGNISRVKTVRKKIFLWIFLFSFFFNYTFHLFPIPDLLSVGAFNFIAFLPEASKMVRQILRLRMLGSKTLVIVMVLNCYSWYYDVFNKSSRGTSSSRLTERERRA